MRYARIGQRISIGVASAMAIAVLMVAAAMLMPAGTALASSPTTTPEAKQQGLHQHLMNWYQREQKWLSLQEDNLQKTGKVIARLQEFIDSQKEKGKDTSALEAALSTYQAQIDTAKSYHTNAANILAAHEGFDVNGQVTNTESARQTLLDGRQALREAHRIMQKSRNELLRAIADYRKNNHPTPAASSTEESAD
jgi:hypothetical protein